MSTEPLIIVMADDDPDDRMITRLALQKCKFESDFRFVSDGEQLLDYLYRRGPYENPYYSPVPGIILLDIHMPKKNGLEVLQEIKSHPEFRHIPIVMLTSSQRKEDIQNSYKMGVNSYINKPVSFKGYLEDMKVIGQYWFDIVRLPSN
ncbi:MAG TPA: response regulator [Balneolales bacterium]|nr:response regulator [Balneolales bacterium]